MPEASLLQKALCKWVAYDKSHNDTAMSAIQTPSAAGIEQNMGAMIIGWAHEELKRRGYEVRLFDGGDSINIHLTWRAGYSGKRIGTSIKGGQGCGRIDGTIPTFYGLTLLGCYLDAIQATEPDTGE